MCNYFVTDEMMNAEKSNFWVSTRTEFKNLSELLPKRIWEKRDAAKMREGGRTDRERTGLTRGS